MDYTAMDPLDLVRSSKAREPPKRLPLDTDNLAKILETIVQTAAGYINTDVTRSFLYKNPNGWKRKVNPKSVSPMEEEEETDLEKEIVCPVMASSFSSSSTNSTSNSSSEQAVVKVPWCLLRDFDFITAVKQITAFIEDWELSPATKFVVIAKNDVETVYPFGQRYLITVHFSKPTPKCPNPLTVAKAYFTVNVSFLLPREYPINVTYRFENYKTVYYAMGEWKLESKSFQRNIIESILHMKLAFFAQICKCENKEETEISKKSVDVRSTCV